MARVISVQNRAEAERIFPIATVNRTRAMSIKSSIHISGDLWTRLDSIYGVFILCKFKSATDRHYWVGKDIHEVRHGLEGWGQTADRVLSGMPPLVINGSH